MMTRIISLDIPREDIKILERLHNTLQNVPDRVISVIRSEIMRPSTPPLEMGKSPHTNGTVFLF